jgi:hypothetical protein
MMQATNPGVLQVRVKTQQVVDHHYDDSKPGKPLQLLIPGGLVALAALAMIGWIAYLTFYDHSMAVGRGRGLIALLAPFYIGGVFLFSYGYELYDMSKALSLTAIVVFITAASFVIVAVLFAALSDMGKSKSSSSSSSNKSSGSSRDSSSSGSGAVLLPGAFGSGMSREVTHEVVKEVPVAPPQPVPIQCPHCGTNYMPQASNYMCPNCSAPATKELIAEGLKGAPASADTAG